MCVGGSVPPFCSLAIFLFLPSGGSVLSGGALRAEGSNRKKKKKASKVSRGSFEQTKCGCDDGLCFEAVVRPRDSF